MLIILSSVLYVKLLVEHLKSSENRQAFLFAKALEQASNTNNKMSFIEEEIINNNNSAPTIVVGSNGKIVLSKNIYLDTTLSEAEKETILRNKLNNMKKSHSPIVINVNNTDSGELNTTQYVYYKNSSLINQLTIFPYIQIVLVAIFSFFFYMLLSNTKFTEQNRVWVGLAKETAHQLGTPISSLMAWVAIMQNDPYIRGKGLVDEIQKDVDKLKIVTERFSSIGSTPVLREENIFQLINRVVAYFQPRISSKIKIEVFTLSETIKVNVNIPLFEWVVENLIKNGVDAIGNKGIIAIKILRGSEGKVFIDFSDNGKGMSKSEINSIFNAGVTTKKRGWGLGLTLTKRIIEFYHEGQIYVKNSEKNIGTTFRVELKSAKTFAN